MKIVQTEITAQFNSPVLIIERNEISFKSPFHYHPEIELVYILEGEGKRIIGDKIENFNAGEVVLIGSNLPHVWMSNEKADDFSENKRARSIVAYFNREIFGKAFYELKEAEAINKLLDNAVRGIKITGNKQAEIANKMKKLLCKEGLEKIFYLIEILHSISISYEIECINNIAYSGYIQKSEQDRLAQVCKYVNANFHNDIKLKDVADIAHLTPQSFCRFFKSRMSKNFLDYLHEVRISYACRYLMETDKTISEIAYVTGFNTVPNFNKQFKNKTGLCPTEYRYNATAEI